MKLVPDGSLCLVSAAILLTLGGSAADAAHAKAAGWRVTCVPGKDEYASNCQATLKLRGLAISLATADSQLFLTVEAPGCAASEAEEQNWFRIDLEGLERSKRRSLVRRAIDRAGTNLRAHCPDLPDTSKLRIEPPDIAMHGPP